MQRANNENQKNLRSFGLSLPRLKSKVQCLVRSLPQGRPAFTLPELMVAMVILIIILGITGSVYKSASDAISRTNSDVGITEDFSTLIRQIDTTMKNVVTDGYLVIYGWDVRDATVNLEERTPDGKTVFRAGGTPDILSHVRSDAICYFTTGSFQSLTAANTRSNAGWVYLGHAGTITPTNMGTSPFDTNTAANPLVANRWVLSRYLLLFTPNTAGSAPGADYRNTTLGYETAQIAQTVINPAPATTRDNFFNYWLFSAGTGTPPAINFTGATPATFPYTLPNCGSFRVEFAMPASFPNVANGSNNTPETDAGTGQIIWRDALQPNGVNYASTGFTPTPANGLNAGGITAPGTRAGNQMVIFGPNDPWPMFVRFTLRKYDENLSGTSDDPETGTKHGGMTMQYVYKLPGKQ
jgi:prepilin-type N-terminal cleavage/methylation domain-containing protein